MWWAFRSIYIKWCKDYKKFASVKLWTLQKSSKQDMRSGALSKHAYQKHLYLSMTVDDLYFSFIAKFRTPVETIISEARFIDFSKLQLNKRTEEAWRSDCVAKRWQTIRISTSVYRKEERYLFWFYCLSFESSRTLPTTIAI